MKTKEDYRIAIVGGGAAGVMAALRGVLNNNKVTLYLGNKKTKNRSRERWVTKIENIPGFHSFAKGIIDPNEDTLEWIQNSEFANNLEIIKASVTEIQKINDETFIVKDSEEGNRTYFSVVLATGLMDVQPHIQGSIKPILPYANVQLADYCIRCDGHHTHKKHVTIIGDKNGAGWVAILLHERYDLKSMTILTNGKKPDFDEQVQKLHAHYGIKTIETEIKEVLGNPSPKAPKLEGYKLVDGTEVNTDITFISLGMIVYNDLAKSLGARVDERGFVVTNNKSESTIKNLYAIGDLQADVKKQIYTSWDVAVNALDDLDNKIRRALRPEL